MLFDQFSAFIAAEMILTSIDNVFAAHSFQSSPALFQQPCLRPDNVNFIQKQRTFRAFETALVQFYSASKAPFPSEYTLIDWDCTAVSYDKWFEFNAHRMNGAGNQLPPTPFWPLINTVARWAQLMDAELLHLRHFATMAGVDVFDI